MIYTYKYLSHRIENFQINISYFFERLFELNLESYDENLLLKPEFIEVVKNSPVILEGNFKEITISYRNLMEKEKIIVKKAFIANSDIENICNDTNVLPVKYSELPAEFSGLLKSFYTNLWEAYPHNIKLESMFGSIKEHFNSFVSADHQLASVCPFCGLHSLKPSGNLNRDAYDHFIPKSLYPFTSINFKNLFPICHECNSDVKRASDTPYSKSNRRALLFPFDSNYNPEMLKIEIKKSQEYNPISYKTLLKDIDWEFEITFANNLDSRLKSWNELFQIKRRYRDYILKNHFYFYEILLSRWKAFKKINENFDFNILKSSLLDESKHAIFNYPLGIIQYIFFSYLFAESEFQSTFQEAHKSYLDS